MTKTRLKSTGNKWIDLFNQDEKSVLAANVVSKPRALTTSPSLNWALGGGFYRGYATCLYGPEGSGKSLISMMAAAALHQADSNSLVVLVSSEMREPPPDRLKILGVDPERLIIRKVNTIHDIFDWIACQDSTFTNSDGSDGPPGMRYLLESGAPIQGLIIDSIKAIRGTKEAALDSLEDNFMGDLSKLLNPCFRGIVETIRKFELMTILIQQVNENMNPDEVKYMNKKWVVPSGQALKHFCEQMALVERVVSKDSKIINEELKNISDKSLQQGHTIRVRVEKANLDSPFREAEFKIDYQHGVVETGFEIAKMATGLGFLHHPLNPETKKPIMNQWAFSSADYDKTWIGFAKALEEINSDPQLQAAMLIACYGV